MSSSLKEVKRTAAIAWSPASQTSPLLATGTLSGALDDSFSTNAELEVYDLKLYDDAQTGSPSRSDVIQKTMISASARFSRLVWSAHGDTEGIIIGGLEDGSVNFWSVSKMLSLGTNGDSGLLARCESHKGAVRGLQVNPFQSHLVASGGTESEVWLWDLNNLSLPYAPSATKSAKLEDVADLAWNRVVPHILATASTSGHTVIWDLKSRKEALTLMPPSGQRFSISSLAWNPENAMQLLVASDDDLNPVIYSWDLRNARAPEKTLHGHEKGVLSLAWCPKDPELLLSSGKDGKAVCWNPKAGSVVSEVIHSQNWLFDVQWCPRNPDVFSVASFAGHIDIYSFQAIMSGGSSSKASNAFASDATPEGFFASNVPGASNTKSTSVSGIMQIPKWLRRPTSVSFGFGGRIVSFSANSGGGKRISITSIPDESAKKIANQSARLDTVLCSQQSAVFADFCSSKIETPVTSLRTDQNTGSQISDSVFWSVAKVLFEEDPREKLMYLLGFDKQKLESQLKKLTLVEERSHPRTPNSSTVLLEHQQSHFKSNPIKKLDLGIDNHIAENDSKGVDFFASLTGKTFNSVQDNPNENGEIDFSSLINSENTLNHEFSQDNAILSQSNKNSAQEAASDSYSVPFPLLPADGNEIDCAITRAIVLGNFEAAVELLVKAERLSDALLVAMCGGEQLVHATHEKYFIQSASSYLRVISGVVRKDLTDIVMNADSSHWEEILALICSYAPNTSAFTRFCRILAGRIEKIYPHAAMLVYMAGGDAPSAASILLSTPVKLPTSAVEESTRLESIIEKIRIMEQTAHQSQLSMTDIVPGRVDSSIYEHTDSPDHLAPIQEMVPAVSEMYLKYAKLMAEIGMLQVSAKYFNSFTGSLSPELIVFGDQLSKSVGYLNIPLRPVEDPFQADRLFITSENDAVVPNLQASGHGLNSLTTNLPYDSQSIQKQLHRDSFSSSNYGMQQHTSSHSVNPEPHHSYTQHNQIPPNHQFGAINQQHPVLPPIAPIQAPYQNYRDPSNVYSQHDSAIPPHFQSPTTGNMGSNQMQNHIQPFAFPPQSSQTLNINTQQNQTHNLHQASSVPSAHQISSKVPGVVNAHLPSPYLPTPSAAPSTTTQPHQNGSAPPIPNQSHPMLLAVSQPLQPQVPMIPLPSDINNYQKSTPPVQLPLASGSYNDAPVVAPRIPSAPIHATMHPSAFVPSPLANLEPPKTSSPLLPALPGNKPVGNSHPHQSQQTSKAPTTATNSGPVDSSQIPPNLMPIYKTINTLILKCQEQAMPMQRRVVEDSARRMQTLFWQLIKQELSAPVIGLLNDMCTRINTGDYDGAHGIHMPLMTGHFTESGAWVLAAKRLIEVAKICVH